MTQKKRRRTKPFLLVLILLYYIFSVDKISWILCGALVTSWIGDLLLIGNGNKWFTAGGISFMLSHFLFIAVYAINFTPETIIWWVIALAVILYYGISLLIVRALKPTTSKSMLVPIYIYLLCNSTMNVFSLMQLMIFRSHLDTDKFKDIIVYRRAKRVEIKAEDGFAYSLDGEIIYAKNFTIEIVPNALNFAAPDY